jgi:hypothetical protein
MHQHFRYTFLQIKTFQMKTLLTFFFSFSFLLTVTVTSAQAKTEKIAVAGECGMCKTTIEKAAKSAGASYAVWDADSKMLAVKLTNASSAAKIEKAVAAAGYDNQGAKATQEAYDKLHACCKYDRTAPLAEKAPGCCNDQKCKESACSKDGKCAKDMSCCKDAGCDKKDCCAKA